eukprot:4397046-Pleurochrysis_carterae.AAC.2
MKAVIPLRASFANDAGDEADVSVAAVVDSGAAHTAVTESVHRRRAFDVFGQGTSSTCTYLHLESSIVEHGLAVDGASMLLRRGTPMHIVPSDSVPLMSSQAKMKGPP